MDILWKCADDEQISVNTYNRSESICPNSPVFPLGSFSRNVTVVVNITSTTTDIAMLDFPSFINDS